MYEFPITKPIYSNLFYNNFHESRKILYTDVLLNLKVCVVYKTKITCLDEI